MSPSLHPTFTSRLGVPRPQCPLLSQHPQLRPGHPGHLRPATTTEDPSQGRNTSLGEQPQPSATPGPQGGAQAWHSQCGAAPSLGPAPGLSHCAGADARPVFLGHGSDCHWAMPSRSRWDAAASAQLRAQFWQSRSPLGQVLPNSKQPPKQILAGSGSANTEQ